MGSSQAPDSVAEDRPLDAFALSRLSVEDLAYFIANSFGGIPPEDTDYINLFRQGNAPLTGLPSRENASYPLMKALADFGRGNVLFSAEVRGRDKPSPDTWLVWTAMAGAPPYLKGGQQRHDQISEVLSGTRLPVNDDCGEMLAYKTVRSLDLLLVREHWLWQFKPDWHEYPGAYFVARLARDTDNPEIRERWRQLEESGSLEGLAYSGISVSEVWSD
jgi:hypothetical protein